MILINSSSKDGVGIFQSFLPIFPHIGVGYLLAAAGQAGIKIKFIDEQVEYDSLSLVREYIKELKPPHIFGFSVLTAGLKSAISVSRQLKTLYPDSIICFGGIHPTAMPEEVLSYEHIDIVFRGEGERALPELYRCLKRGEDFTHINNISYRKDKRIIHNKRDFIEDLNELPPFPYHLFSPEKYNLGFVASSRGCPYECIFCSNRLATGRLYRYRSAESIIKDIEILHCKYGINNIAFLDDNFLVNKQRIYTLLEMIRKKEFDKGMVFSFQGRGDNTDYKLLKEMYDTGFNNTGFGIETASETLMSAIKKGETVKQVCDAIAMAKEIGYYVTTTFMFGLPGETHKDRVDAIKLSKRLGLDMIKFNNAIPYPGTDFYRIAKEEGRLNVCGLYENFSAVGAFCESPFKSIAIPYLPYGTSEAAIRRDIMLGYLAFYLNPKNLNKVFIKEQTWFDAGKSIKQIVKKIPALVYLTIMMTIKFIQLFFDISFRKETRMGFGELKEIFIKG